MTSSDQTSFEKGFSLHNRARESRAPLTLLITLQSRALASLSDLIKTLFNYTDDAFFELAESAQSNNEQNLFFEAMRELRLHAHDVDNRFRELMGAEFDRLQSGEPDLPPRPRQQDADNGLALVDKDKMEIEVAVGNMRSKLRTQYPDLLLHLSQRLNHYLSVDWLNENNNPLGPEKLVDHFVEAASQLQLPLKIRLMLYKYFERHVIDNLRGLLEDSNRILVDAGILPNVRVNRAKKSEASRPAMAADDSAGIDLKSLQEALLPADEAAPYAIQFADVQALMTQLYTSSLNHRLFGVQPGQSGRELDNQALMAVLNRLQEAQAHTSQDDDPLHSHVDHLDVRLLLEHQLAHTARETGARKLRQVDDDVINLVSMVFEFILDDRNLAPEVSLLLGRLQIPVIKIALQDKRFFSEPDHPTRRLLKLLSQAALGWEKESLLQRDLLLEEMRIVVNRILNEFNGFNLELFSTLEQTFGSFLKEEMQRAELVEKRVLQSAQGQARMEQARRLINQLINDRLQGKTLPSVVIDMLDGPWRTLMLQVLLRHGRDADPWRHCLQTVDDLIWSIQPANAAADRERWVKMIPLLLKSICNGLESIRHPGIEVDKFLSSLWEIHGQILQNPPDKPLPNSRTIDHTLAEPQDSRRSAIDRQRERLAERTVQFDPDTPANQELKHRILQLKVGQWAEVSASDGKTRRCKLAYREPESDLYLFVSRRGHKVLETDLASLLRMMLSDEFRLLQSGSIWDRALSAVMGRMAGTEKAKA
ncbi:MAG: DUF1631 domain-containing protein [Pseudomonadota bacterium]